MFWYRKKNKKNNNIYDFTDHGNYPQVKNFINANKCIIELHEGIASPGTWYGPGQDNEFRFEVNGIYILQQQQQHQQYMIYIMVMFMNLIYLVKHIEHHH